MLAELNNSRVNFPTLMHLVHHPAATAPIIEPRVLRVASTIAKVVGNQPSEEHGTHFGTPGSAVPHAARDDLDHRELGGSSSIAAVPDVSDASHAPGVSDGSDAERRQTSIEAGVLHAAQSNPDQGKRMEFSSAAAVSYVAHESDLSDGSDTERHRAASMKAGGPAERATLTPGWVSVSQMASDGSMVLSDAEPDLSAGAPMEGGLLLIPEASAPT